MRSIAWLSTFRQKDSPQLVTCSSCRGVFVRCAARCKKGNGEGKSHQVGLLVAAQQVAYQRPRIRRDYKHLLWRAVRTRAVSLLCTGPRAQVGVQPRSHPKERSGQDSRFRYLVRFDMAEAAVSGPSSVARVSRSNSCGTDSFRKGAGLCWSLCCSSSVCLYSFLLDPQFDIKSGCLRSSDRIRPHHLGLQLLARDSF
jgi:hypothetical protein